MSKKAVVLIGVVLLSATGLVQAQQEQLSGTVDLTYLSSYIWRGFDLYGQSRSAIQPSINLDLYGTGFGLSIFCSRANGGGRENLEELRYNLNYTNGLYKAENYATNYQLGYTYFSYPDMPKKAYNMQEVFASLSWPKICPAGVVPSYTAICSWPSEGKSTMANSSGGWLHILGLGYDMTVSGLTPDIPEQTFHLSTQLVYNDGAWDFANPTAGVSKVDHDWSHAVFGVSTDFDLGNNLSLTPAIYYQASMDDSVNKEDETWISMTLRYKF